MAENSAAKDMEWAEPKTVWEEYQTGTRYKNELGSKGLYEQNRINERFYSGDQWHGASVGTNRPLVRYNVIKRIGDYKQAVVGASPVSVIFSAEGVPNTVDLQERVNQIREKMSKDPTADMASLLGGNMESEVPAAEEVNIVVGAMSDYFRVTGERLQFDDKKERVLKNAYTSGTGILYTYWDERIKTGLYADENRKTPIKGDITCEILDVENVYFGDPTSDDLQNQPFIIVAQRKTVDEVKRDMRRNKAKQEDIDELKADTETDYMAGELGAEGTQNGVDKVTVLTKFYKEWDDNGNDWKVMAVQTTEKLTVREPWDLGIRCYPFSVFIWERRRNCAYGDSEVTYLVPNQVAINRMITASVWAVMMMGMPIMLVNRDVVQQDISNEPGQIIDVNGGDNDVVRAVSFVNPPNFSPNFSHNVEQMIAQTLTQSGANDAALGDVRPDNTSAIIAVREAATMPLQMLQNRFYTFVEDTARVWAEFWLTQYGKRALKVVDSTGTWYMPFDGDRYKEMLISTKIDVGASNLWSEAQTITTLDNLFNQKVINVIQYLERLPKGTVPNVDGLIKEMQAANAAMAGQQGQAPAPAPGAEQMPAGVGVTPQEILEGLSPDALQQIQNMPNRVQGAIMEAGMNAANNVPENMPIGELY